MKKNWVIVRTLTWVTDGRTDGRRTDGQSESSIPPYPHPTPQPITQDFVVRVIIRHHLHNKLQWCHNESDDVSNHQPHDCLLSRLFRHRWKKHQNSASLTIVRGIHRWPVYFQHKEPGGVSLTFHDISKIISRKYTMPEITFTVRISSWNSVCVPKAWRWAHVQSFSLNSHKDYDFCNTQISREYID